MDKTRFVVQAAYAGEDDLPVVVPILVYKDIQDALDVAATINSTSEFVVASVQTVPYFT